MVDISEETHAFRQGKSSCIYSTVLYLLQKVNLIKKARLCQLVKEKINKINKLVKTNLSNDTDENNRVIEKSSGQMNKVNSTNNEDEIEALASLCKIMFSVVFVTKTDQVTASVYVKYYSRNSSLVQQRAYMIYDETYKHYAPLYLFNKSDANQLITIFNRKDNHIINILLRKFFKEQLNYHEPVKLNDETNIMVSEISPRVQNPFDNMPDIIYLNTEQNPLKNEIIKNEIEGNKCVIMSNSPIETADTSEGDQLSPNTAYEFRRKDVPGDGSCLYWSFLDILNRSNWMNMKRLRNEVADVIFDMDIADATLLDGTGCQTRLEYCDQIRKNAWAGEFEVLALAKKYNLVIAIVNININEQNKLSINVINYGEDNQSCTKRVYIIYDRVNEHYEPLYLCDKNNPNKYRTIFNRYDTMVNTLLEDFIRKQHCHHELQKFGGAKTSYDYDISNMFIDDSNILQELSTLGNHQSSTGRTIITTDTHEFRIGELPGDDQCLFSSVIYLFDRSQTINIKSLRQNVANHIRQSKDINDISFLHNTHCQTREDYCHKIEEGIIWSNDLERHALAYLYPKILFCIISITNNQNAPSVQVDTYVKDISSYKKCIIILYNTSVNIYAPLYLYDKIRHEEENISFKYDDITKILLKEFIRKILNYHGHINLDVDSTYDELELDVDVQSEFCDVFEKIAGNTTADLPKIPILEKSKSHDKILSSKHDLNSTPKFFQKSVAADGDCLFSSRGLSEEITTFNRNDKTTKEFLCDFIYEKFAHYGRIKFSDKTNGDEFSSERLVEGQSCHPSNSINENTKKRKAPDNDDNPFMTDTTKKLTPVALTTNQVVNIQSSTSSRSIPAGDHIYIAQNELSDSIQQLLQTDILHTSNSSTIKQENQSSLNILSNNTTVSHTEQMRFETELISEFRGRLLSDYQPKSEFRRDGTKSEPRPPTYFADPDNQHCLNLLIPETFLFGDLNRVRVEITIITRTINGCTYIHPYFKFYDLRPNRTSVTTNPLLIDLGFDELHKLTKCSEGMYKLQLYLVVVMLTNGELLRNQPIKLFQPSTSNEQNITTKYKHCDTYKKDFHLNVLRFAATLLIKNTDDNKYHRRVDLQCISTISTEDRNFIVGDMVSVERKAYERTSFSAKKKQRKS